MVWQRGQVNLAGESQQADNFMRLLLPCEAAGIGFLKPDGLT